MKGFLAITTASEIFRQVIVNQDVVITGPLFRNIGQFRNKTERFGNKQFFHSPHYYYLGTVYG
jgi:hypothetical protein